ncbi:phytoene/squalene synthase family protein [Luteimonas sp. BDR2-5]|uniref:phytoene/squalene synthase family protein n=1 Tax=Proluteimonas luteida TaxID=2878685 RepID=UPI001E35E79C|nr:phytoene/squalene synthase family protein [Luteimonas sp. BDR2-5]MCD9026932.1 phytoene/squalene synthase family protein [Luteimonas sp. BDR2-5]
MTTDVAGDDDFLGKWQARWPEWRIGMAFVPEAQHPRVRAWFALLDELGDAAWGGSDPTPGLAKLAWWQEELQGWAKQARRHPLALHLYRLDAPWQMLAQALRALPATREHPEDADANLDRLRDLALAVAACETTLLGTGSRGDGGGRLSTAPLLAAQAFLVGSQPLAGALLARWPARDGGTRPRRIHDAILQARLQSLARNGVVRAVPAPAMLLRGWRAARG